MPKIVSIANFKGGVGKTTSAANIGAALARSGRRTLLIDLDPQFNLTQSLGIDPDGPTIYGILRDQYPPAPVPVFDNLDLIPSSIELIKAEIELSGVFKREFILQSKIEPIKSGYDFILIDCPPSLGILTINAFVASDFIFVPIEAEYLALKGYSILNEAIRDVGLEIDKVFITKFDSRKILNRSVKDSIFKQLEGRTFKTIIRENVALAEAPISGLDIFRYNPSSYGAEDYEALTAEIIAL